MGGQEKQSPCVNLNLAESERRRPEIMIGYLDVQVLFNCINDRTSQVFALTSSL